MPNNGCPMCGSEQCTYLGTLGSVQWVRCAACGWDYTTELELNDDDDTQEETNDE
jgi:rubredoxin